MQKRSRTLTTLALVLCTLFFSAGLACGLLKAPVDQLFRYLGFMQLQQEREIAREDEAQSKFYEQYKNDLLMAPTKKSHKRDPNGPKTFQ